MVAFFYKLLQHALLSDCRKDQFSSSSDNVTYSEILISIAIPSRRIKQHVLIGGIWSFPFVIEIFLYSFFLMEESPFYIYVGKKRDWVWRG